jgi:hypothetical protein
MADQLTDDFTIKTYYPMAIVGQSYTIGADPCTGKGGVTKVYKGTDIVADMIGDMMRKFPDVMNYDNARLLLANPTTFVAPAFKLDPKVVAGLVALQAAGKLAQLTGLSSSFLAPGISAAVKGVTSAISDAVGTLPFKNGSAADITSQINAVKTMLQTKVSGPNSTIFAAVTSKFLSDIPTAAMKAATISLPKEISLLAGAAGNAVAFAAKAAFIARTFPMLDVNKMMLKMITNINGCKPNKINSMVPNMAMFAGAVALKALAGQTPTGNAVKPQKTPKSPGMMKPVEMKNLFAESAAAISVADLSKSMSQFMGMMATIAPQKNLIAEVPAKVSLGDQKLTSSANSVNWGSGGYGRNSEFEEQERKRLEMSAKIEKHTKELEQMVDYSKLTSMPYSELIKKYPQITPKTTVAEALQIINDAEKKTANTTSTMTG